MKAMLTEVLPDIAALREDNALPARIRSFKCSDVPNGEIAHVDPDVAGLELVAGCGGGEDGVIPVSGRGVHCGDGGYFLNGGTEYLGGDVRDDYVGCILEDENLKVNRSH